MHLVTERESMELGKLTAKGEPPGHYFPDRFPAPQAEIEAGPRLRRASCDTCDYSVLFAPAGDFEPGNGSRDRGLADLDRL